MHSWNGLHDARCNGFVRPKKNRTEDKQAGSYLFGPQAALGLGDRSHVVVGQTSRLAAGPAKRYRPSSTSASPRPSLVHTILFYYYMKESSIHEIVNKVNLQKKIQ